VVRGASACALALAALGGCVTTPETTASFPEPLEPVVILQPGDAIEVNFAYHPEYNSAQTIRPDGIVSLQLVNEVQAAGLQPVELREMLLAAYGEQLRNPEINVVVRSLSNQRVYVGGEVRAPGLVPLVGPLTLMEAIMSVGGFVKESAKISEVVVIRRRDGEQYARTVDLRETLETPESATFYLEPHDIVFVPRTNIDKVDQWVEQYVNRIIPRNVQMQFLYDTNQQDFDTGNARSRNYSISTPAAAVAR
jgi:protein involved in polysaccharide export with SLBB domain